MKTQARVNATKCGIIAAALQGERFTCGYAVHVHTCLAKTRARTGGMGGAHYASSHITAPPLCGIGPIVACLSYAVAVVPGAFSLSLLLLSMHDTLHIHLLCIQHATESVCVCACVCPMTCARVIRRRERASPSPSTKCAGCVHASRLKNRVGV